MTRSQRKSGTLVATVGLMLGAPCFAAEEDNLDLVATSQYFLKSAQLEEPNEPPPPPIQRFLIPEKAGKVLQFLDQASQGDEWESNSACQLKLGQQPQGWCHLRWRKTDVFSSVRGRYADITHRFKSNLVGEKLAEHLEVDLDTSPEIKFKWDID